MTTSAADRLDSLYAFVSDPAQRVLLAQTPLLMMPRRGALPALRVGQRRYVAACDGIYVQARSMALEVTLLYARTPPLPFGGLPENVAFAGGLLPYAFFDSFARAARLAAPIEAAALVLWDGDRRAYRMLPRESTSASAGHITYTTGDVDDAALVLDLHSHGDGAAFFSPTDDHSDRNGVFMSCVLGHCRDPNGPEIKTRICVDGFFYPVPWVPWEVSNATNVFHS